MRYGKEKKKKKYRKYDGEKQFFVLYCFVFQFQQS